MTNTENKILFICKGNWFRSQMAAAIYNKLTATNDADSAGTYVGAADEPEGQRISDLFSTPQFFEVMEEHGINIRDHRTRQLLPSMMSEYGTIVSMAEEPYIPDFLKNSDKTIVWDIGNPTGVDRKVAQDDYQKIERLIKDLIKTQEQRS